MVLEGNEFSSSSRQTASEENNSIHGDGDEDEQTENENPPVAETSSNLSLPMIPTANNLSLNSLLSAAAEMILNRPLIQDDPRRERGHDHEEAEIDGPNRNELSNPRAEIDEDAEREQQEALRRHALAIVRETNEFLNQEIFPELEATFDLLTIPREMELPGQLHLQAAETRLIENDGEMASSDSNSVFRENQSVAFSEGVSESAHYPGGLDENEEEEHRRTHDHADEERDRKYKSEEEDEEDL